MGFISDVLNINKKKTNKNKDRLKNDASYRNKILSNRDRIVDRNGKTKEQAEWEKYAEEQTRLHDERAQREREMRDWQDAQEQQRKAQQKYIDVNTPTLQPRPGQAAGKKTNSTFDEYLRSLNKTNSESELFKKTVGATPTVDIRNGVQAYRRTPVVDPELMEQQQKKNYFDRRRREDDEKARQLDERRAAEERLLKAQQKYISANKPLLQPRPGQAQGKKTSSTFDEYLRSLNGARSDADLFRITADETPAEDIRKGVQEYQRTPVADPAEMEKLQQKRYFEERRRQDDERARQLDEWMVAELPRGTTFGPNDLQTAYGLGQKQIDADRQKRAEAQGLLGYEGIKKNSTDASGKFTYTVADQKRIQAERDKAKAAGYYDGSIDPSMLSDEALALFPEAMQAEADKKQKSAEQMAADYEARTATKAWEEAYDFIDKIELRTKGASRAERVGRRKDNIENADNYFRYSFDQDVFMLQDDPQVMREALYNDLMYGRTSYAEITANMTPEEKTQLDGMLDNVLEEAFKNYGTWDPQREGQYEGLIKESWAYGGKIAEAQQEQENRQKIKSFSELAATAPTNGDYDPELRPEPKLTYNSSADTYIYEPQGTELEKAYFSMNEYTDDDEQGYGHVVNKYVFASDEQKLLFNRLYKWDKQNGTNYAGAYLEGLDNYLQAMLSEYQDTVIRMQAEDPVLGTANRILSYPENVIGGFAGLAGTGAALLGVESAKDKNSNFYLTTKMVRTTREQQNENLDKWAVDTFGDWAKGKAKFLANVVDSIGDNLFAMGTANMMTGNVASNAGMRLVQLIMSGEATSNTMLEKLDENMDPTEAALYSIGDGIIEWITEKWSLEALLKPDVKAMLGNKKQIAAFLAKTATAEGSEEIASDLLNIGLDKVLSNIYGHEDELKKRYDELVVGGMTDTEATRAVLHEKFNEVAMSGLAGAISGGIMGGSRVVSNAFTQNRMGKNVSEVNSYTDQNGTKQLIEKAKALGGESQSARMAAELEEKIKKGEKISDKKLGQLAQNIQMESQEQAASKEKEILQDAAEKELRDKGFKAQEAKDMAELIVRQQTEGVDSLSRKERMMLQESPTANQVIRDLNGETELSERVSKEIGEQTKVYDDAAQAATNLMRGRTAEGIDVRTVGKQLATQDEIDRAEGKRTKSPREVIVDREFGELEGMARGRMEDGKFVPAEDGTEPNRDDVWKYAVKVNGKTKYVDATDIKGTNFSTAAVIRDQAMDPYVYSGRYTNLLIDQIEKGNIQNVGRYLSDAYRIRWAAYTGKEMPQTGIAEEAAREIYRLSQMDKIDERKVQKEQANFKGAGNGTATFKNTEYGTQEFEDAIRDLDQETQDRIRFVADWAKTYGIDIQFADLNDTKNPWMHGSESSKGIVLNLESYDNKANQAKGIKHNIVATLGHEATHWLQRNNAAAYYELEEFVLNKMQAEGYDVAQRAQEIMESRRKHGQNISMTQAIDEIVANACDQVLGNPETVNELKKQHGKLYTKLKEYVNRLIDRIKSVTADLGESASIDAQRIMYKYGNELAKLWNGAMDEVLTGKIRQLDEAKQEKEIKEAQESLKLSVAENVRLSQAEFTNGIQKGMSDEQRYDVLKNTKVTIANSAGKITNNELTYYGELKKYDSTDEFRKLAIKNGIINKQFENKYIKNLPAVFSLKSLKETMHHHNKEGYTNLAALMPVFKETFENAVPIMAQEDRYRYVIKNKTSLKTYIQLLGAFRFGSQIVPVKFEIKEIDNESNGKLYIVATINKDAILTDAPQMSGSPIQASSEISIEDIIQKVNKNDVDILYTIPSQFLNKDQLKGKRQGLIQHGDYIREKAESKNKVKNYNVDMTTERINSLIDEYGNDSNAYVAYINPQSFVDLTAKDSTQVMNESHPMNGSEMRNEKQTPVIRIDSSTGDIISSDGQKRLQAMALAGVRQVAVLVVDETAANDGNRKTIDSLDIHGNNSSDMLKNLVPIDSQHRDELVNTFSSDNGWFKYSIAELDAEYEEAVNRGDVNRAEQMLMDRYQEMEKYGIIGYRAPHFNSGEHAEIAERIKKGDPEAIRTAAKDMAAMVPENAVLIPMPPHSGQVTEETDTMLLARAISEITGAPVINALESNEHISRMEAKEKNIRGVSADSMGFQQVAEIPEDAMPVYIDNMVGGGVTAKAAHDAVGRGITLAYAQSARAKIGGAKFIGITKDNGELIPLSERMDPDNKSWKFSMAEDTEADVGVWMMGLTESSVHTEGERALIREYRGLKTSLELCRKRQGEYMDKIAKLQTKSQLTAEERDTLIILQNKLQVQQDKQARLEQELYDVTRSEGYAGMMYRNSRIFDDYVNGKNQQQVEAAVDTLINEAEQAEKNIEKRQREIRRMAEDAAVNTIRKELKNRGLSWAANEMKKNYFTAMSTGEIEGRLAEIVLRAVNGEDITAEIESLAGDMVTNGVGFGSEIAEEALSNVRGMTIEIGPGQQAEMKANHLTLKDLRERTKGSGVTFKYGTRSTLDVNAEEIGDLIPDLRESLKNEKGSLQGFVDWIERQLDSKKGNAQDYGVNPDEVAVVITTCANAMMDAEQGGMSPADLRKRIEAAQGEIGKLADAVDGLMQSAKEMKNSAMKASNATGGLRADAVAAIDYYNLIAKQAAEVERNRVKRTVIDELRSENTRKLIEQQMKFQEMLKKDRRARELQHDNEQLRKVITTDVKRLKDRLVAETDLKNVQEEAKPLARQLVSMLVDHDMAGWRHVLFSDKRTLTDVQMRLAKMEAANGSFDMDADLDFLVIKAPNAEDNDYSLKDKVLEDLMHIEQGLLEYRNAEGKGNVSLADRKAALEKVQEAVTEIYDVIMARETAFINGQRQNVLALATQMERDMAESRFKGERRGTGSGARNAMVKAVNYGNMTPEYFFKYLRNGTMQLLHKGLQDAEQNSGLQAREAQERIAQIAKDTGFATWDGQEKKTVTLSNGKRIQMSVEQLMALYATWNREKNQLRPEETSHLLKGGFVLAEGDTTEGKPRKEKSSLRPIRVNEADLNSIGSYLTDQQKEYADAVVEYMSTDLAKIGNEASLRTYGIRKFTESYYFPTKSWGGVLNRSSASGISNQNENRAMRQSFTKRITAGARNALEIGDFTPTAMRHITGMITFNTVGPAVENLNKVLNQQLDYYEDEEMDPDEAYKRNMRTAFEENYGKAAYDYLTTFMQDVNGGVGRRMETSLREKLLSVFRKGAVAGSLSVSLQQPLSYIRAAMEIDTKYLLGALSPTQWGRIHDEMTKYSGIAVIKDMGRFDMNQGQSMIEFITPEEKESAGKKAWEKFSEATTIGPEKMDAVTWGRMWIACKLEQAAKNPGLDTKSDEFLEKVAERFNDVMRRTQVYDSVMVKSQNMRSKNYAIKAMTSFMAEPTLSLNVLADAVQNAKEKGGKAKLAKAAATFLLSAAAQAAAKALMSSGRSPDKRKTWEEQFLTKWASMFISEANPLGLIPGFSDIVEVLKNGELTDDAIGVLGKIQTIWQKSMNWISGKDTDTYRSIEDTFGQVFQLFTNVPVKNLMRDGRAMYNFFNPNTYAKRETSGAVIRYGILDAIHTQDNLTGVINKYMNLAGAGYFDTTSEYAKRIYEAQKRGDEQAAKDMTDYYVLAKSKAQDPEKNLSTALNSMAKKDKSLSAEEKIAALEENGYKSTGTFILDQLKKGEIDRKSAEELYRKERPDADEKKIAETLDGAEWTRDGKSLPEWQKEYTNYTPLYAAMMNNKAEEIRDAVDRMTKLGYDAKAIRTDVNKKIKAQYLAADANGRIRLKDAMEKAYKALGFTAEDADKTISNWTKEKKKEGSSALPEMIGVIGGNGMSDVGSKKKSGNYGKGNINLDDRPIVVNKDGSISTERSFSFWDEDEQKEILVPTVINGKIVSENKAIDHYYETGEYLGKFDTVKEADEYAEKTHRRLDTPKTDGTPYIANYKGKRIVLDSVIDGEAVSFEEAFQWYLESGDKLASFKTYKEAERYVKSHKWN